MREGFPGPLSGGDGAMRRRVAEGRECFINGPLLPRELRSRRIRGSGPLGPFNVQQIVARVKDDSANVASSSAFLMPPLHHLYGDEWLHTTYFGGLARKRRLDGMTAPPGENAESAGLYHSVAGFQVCGQRDLLCLHAGGRNGERPPDDLSPVGRGAKRRPRRRRTSFSLTFTP